LDDFSPVIAEIRVLFSVQLVEPVFNVAEGAEKAEAGLGQVEGCVERVLILLTFVDAGQLLRFWGGLGLSIGAGGGSVAEVELGEDRP
jgi:hypothetical protein